MTVAAYAQTNLQLYNQLQRAGLDEPALRQVHAAYELAMRLMAGHFRPNHKPFVAHLVGVASILAAHGAPGDVVGAGLLHSVYEFGNFGDAEAGICERKRRAVRAQVSADCEALVARYAVLPFRPQQWLQAAREATPLRHADRTVAWIRLADVLEDYQDLGMRYAPRKNGGASDNASSWQHSVLELAAALGHDALRAELQQAFAADLHGDVALVLQTTDARSFTLSKPARRGVVAREVPRLVRRLRTWAARRGILHGTITAPPLFGATR